MSEASDILKKYWGHDAFRPLQESIINAVIQNDDVLALLPTGGGKSVCFQIPALLREGICIVVSPLIALIKDQVESLQSKGIPALSIYSGMHYNEVKQTLQNAAFGDYKFLYVSPERLQTSLFLEFLPAIKPSLIVIDEAHCISQWGYDFRPAYLKIAQLRAELPDVNIIAVTASATPEVQEDICRQLQFSASQQRFQQSFVRNNISYSCFAPEAKQVKLLEILRNVRGSSIVYCNSRKHTQDIARLLQQNGTAASYYHAGLDNNIREKNQEEWLKGKLSCMVCTNAFGMGIDKSNVRVVVHYDIPESLENYYQEAGRAGRDGHRAYAVLLYEKNELATLLNKLELKFPKEEYIKQVYLSLMNHLQVAAGAGKDLGFDFDLALFAQYFKLNILEASFAIKALQEEGLISYSEVSFKPSHVSFICTREDLQICLGANPELTEIAQGLLRSYEGIFDFPCTIYESLLAKLTRQPKEKTIAQLLQLRAMQIISYKPGSDKQQVYLLENRMYTDSFKIDIEKLHLRKSFYKERIEAMVKYVSDATDCRNMQIANYFGDETAIPCGVCDNCFSNKKEGSKENTYAYLLQAIKQYLSDGNCRIDELLKHLKKSKTASVWSAIKLLEAELIIERKGENTIGLVGSKN